MTTILVTPTAEPANNEIPVTWPRPSWATEAEVSDGYVHYRGPWTKLAEGDSTTSLHRVEYWAQLTCSDELTLRPDGSVVAEREQVYIHVRAGDRPGVLMLPAELDRFAEFARALVEAAGGPG